MTGKDPVAVIVNPDFSLSVKMEESDDFQERDLRYNSLSRNWVLRSTQHPNTMPKNWVSLLDTTGTYPREYITTIHSKKRRGRPRTKIWLMKRPVGSFLIPRKFGRYRPRTGTIFKPIMSWKVLISWIVNQEASQVPEMQSSWQRVTAVSSPSKK